MSHVLAVEQLAKSYGSRRALDGVSFEAGPGELLGLLGPNGAGKTTLIRCLTGRVKPDAGIITLLGRPLPRRGGRERLGFVPQELGVYPDLTTRENLHAFGVFNGLRGVRLRERITWALEWTGLADRAGDLPKNFSGGMKRRVNIACGVLHEPQVLLLDEPTVGVDPQSRERIFAMIETLREAGTTVLLTTHHLEEAEQRCDRIVVIDHGRVIAQGTLNELIDATVGPNRLATVRLVQPLPLHATESIQLEWSPVNGSANGHGAEPRVLRTQITSVADELPRMLESVARFGGEVRDVEVQSPNLQSVFLHLTGRELRE
ncbi:Daunorubicin/doxorubicin resistance ATP-binding protein DrrA [Botrimarina colliarenosi]|uniref:Daunorubicin/doxorubicin resistance ATP-binding protein DrrA n=1 Tax=Botrimarina colliarenosi TaxID=2528001 RepID=A0A5C6ALL8_9BACT|nr:ABC transporter ATP-binding protein [Botrimarina colliarenosi]TWU00368.1 Daunorubicin/doxorubicin resistance ATP-binding protein DrrA [Botrimarina colliarenosi]